MEIRTGAGAYVCGEETALLNSLEGKQSSIKELRRKLEDLLERVRF